MVGCKALGKTSDALDYPKADVDAKYSPLKHIRERPAVVSGLGVPKSAAATIGESVYVHDLKKLLSEKPPGTVKYDALLRHEQEHAKRQKDRGVFLWVCRYTYDRKFMWKEEQIGWYYTITLLRKGGLQINVDATATVLKGYRNLAGRMVSFAEAKAWVIDVLNGKWTPPSG